MRRIKIVGFILCLVLWAFLTFLCYHKIIVFDNDTFSGAMLSSLILTTSILGIVRLLKVVYEVTFSALVGEKE